MKRKINSYGAYVITETDDGYYLSDCNGFVFESEDLIEIGKGLIEFAKHHKTELEQHNIEREKELYEDFCWYKSEPKQPKPKAKAYVYILKCGEYHKIGYSKDVKRRVKELDNRPYKVEVVYVSPPLVNAFELELELHDACEGFRISGEWYDLPPTYINIIRNYIDSEGDRG